MKLTPDQLKSLGYDPNDHGSVLRKVATVPIPAHEKPDLGHFQGLGNTQVAQDGSKRLKSVLWMDYEIQSYNRTRYRHWSVVRKESQAAKAAWFAACVGWWVKCTGNIVHIISMRSRILDSDNYIAGCKGVRDAIAESLGMDDSDRFIEWHYHQIIGKPHGTLVMIA